MVAKREARCPNGGFARGFTRECLSNLKPKDRVEIPPAFLRHSAKSELPFRTSSPVNMVAINAWSENPLSAAGASIYACMAKVHCRFEDINKDIKRIRLN